jgi:DNA polymerase-3 subunit gamma/tau
MSKFVVSARKYRPTAFDEVVGQMHVAKTLKNALQTEQLAHAFLFCGPRGVGKTTCARILAKVINCENPKDKVDPCNECSSCQSFNDNASFNIIELDGASNNSVEHIRTLIEQVRFQPQHGTHKVFIIDEVHMLSSQAFNAFLKTLEEPPPYAIFILATTEKHKIIPTILSRCQIFDFKRIQVQDVVKQLEHICTQEGKIADPEALHLIGQKADGAMRDALSIFDKIASASGKHITYKDVIANLNILDYEYYFKIVDAFLREDLSDVLLIMDEIMRSGFEPDQLIQGLADHMRDLLVCKDGRTLGLLDVSESLKIRYQHQAALTSKSVLLTGLDILNQCDVTLPRSKNKRLYTEIALSKINFANRAIETNLMSPQGIAEKKTKVVTEPVAAPSINTALANQVPAPVQVEPVQNLLIRNRRINHNRRKSRQK